MSTPWIDANCYDFSEEEQSFSDVTLCIGESKYKAHKVILANSSKYFDRKFIAEEECEDVDLEYLNIQPSLLSTILYFLYTGGNETQFDEDDTDRSTSKVPSMIHNGNILSLWKCAKELQIESLVLHCSNFFSQYSRDVDALCVQQLLNWLNKCSSMNLEEVEGMLYCIFV